MYKKFDLFFGFAVIGIFIWFLFILLSGAFNLSIKTYSVKASFLSADGIAVGSEVKIAGVKIGEVSHLKINQNTFSAEVVMKISSKYRIPTDSSANIQSSGLLGGRYIEIIPGFEDDSVSNGDTILKTQSGINLEKLISNFASGGLKN